MRPPSLDDVLADARAAGSAGRWPDAHARLAVNAAHLGSEPAFALASAEAALRVGQPSEARRWATAAAQAPARFLSPTGRAQAANFAGAASLALGDLDAAERHFAEALELAHGAEFDLGAARALNNLAIVADIRGRRDDALSLYESALPLYQRLGHGAGLAGAFHNMALALRHLRRLEQADACEQRAAEHAREAGEARVVEAARVGRAEILLLQGDPLLAEAAASRAAGALGALGQHAHEADALRVVGVARLRRGEPASALPASDHAVALARDAHDRLILAECLLARALVRQALADQAGARADGTEAAALFEALGAREPLAEAREVLARLAS
jgi:tetratricopeptide (TPR) repeat protein